MKKQNLLLLAGAGALGYYMWREKQLKASGIKGIGAIGVDNLHLISVKYIGASNSRGARVKIESKRFQQSITEGYNYRLNSALDMGVDMLRQRGFNIIGVAEFGDVDFIITDSFKPLK
jgi:hypothetical protein